MIGKTISHYKILEKIGEGGMGMVYKAEDTTLKRTVALKFLSTDLTRDEESKTRFIHEAQAASALDHPNICNIHEIGETEEGQSFIAMACYEGVSLRDRIAGGKELPDAQRSAAAGAVLAVHAAQCIHDVQDRLRDSLVDIHEQLRELGAVPYQRAAASAGIDD